MIGYVYVATSKNTLQMYFSMKFNLNLKWIDDRIKYRNLKDPHFKNLVAHEVREVARVWISETCTHPTLFSISRIVVLLDNTRLLKKAELG